MGRWCCVYIFILTTPFFFVHSIYSSATARHTHLFPATQMLRHLSLSSSQCPRIANSFILFSILFNYFFSNSLAAAAACTIPFRMCGGENVHIYIILHTICNELKKDGQKNSEKKVFFARVLTDFVLFAFFRNFLSLPRSPACECKVCASVAAIATAKLLLLCTLTCMYEHCYVFKLHFKLHSILYLNLQDFWVHAKMLLLSTPSSYYAISRYAQFWISDTVWNKTNEQKRTKKLW